MNYPKLMESTNATVIVYFIEVNKGYIIEQGAYEERVGYWSTHWDMDVFYDIESTPELRKVMQQVVPGMIDRNAWLKAMQ